MQHEGRKYAVMFWSELDSSHRLFVFPNTIEQQPGWRVDCDLLRRCMRGLSAPVHVPGTPQVPASALRNEGAAGMACW